MVFAAVWQCFQSPRVRSGGAGGDRRGAGAGGGGRGCPRDGSGVHQRRQRGARPHRRRHRCARRAVAVQGWAEQSTSSALDLARRFEDVGVAAIIFTDIGRDGVLAGPNVEATVDLARAVRCSGDRLRRRLVAGRSGDSQAAGDGIIAGVICGRALYDGRIDVAEAVAMLKRTGPAIRRGQRHAEGPHHSLPRREAGRVVKGVNFVDLATPATRSSRRASTTPPAPTSSCFLDITASHENRDTIFDVVARTAEQCFMPLTVGGGVRSVEDIRKLLLAGADKVSINTAAVARPEFVAEAAEKFGSQCIVVAIDAKSTGADRFEVFTHGGRNGRPASTRSHWARRMTALGAGEILLTSMDRDGTKHGFDLPLTRAMADAVPVPVIASGGVGTLDHLVEGVTRGHASAVLAASIFHFGTFTIAQAKAHMRQAGVPIRSDAAAR